MTVSGNVSSQICIANINPLQRRRRLLGGVVALAISLVLLAVLIAAGEPRWWRLALVVTFWAAAVGYFQWHDRT